MPFSLIRILRRKQKPEHLAATLPSSTSNNQVAGLSSVNAIDPPPVTVNVNIGGITCGDISAPVLSNNNFFTAVTVSGPQASPQDEDEDYAKVKAYDIVLETDQGTWNTDHDLQPDGTLIKVGYVQEHTGYILGKPNDKMLIRHYMGRSIMKLKQDLEVFSAVKHPYILQLYGLCNAKKFTALIFQDGRYQKLALYSLTLPATSFVTYFYNIITEFNSAAKALGEHDLQPLQLLISWLSVNTAGHLVVKSYSRRCLSGLVSVGPAISLISPNLESVISSWPNPYSFNKSQLVNYYGLLSAVCDSSPHESFDFSITHQDTQHTF
ncbi:hypothetical protein C8J56DRAFT_1031392, partial [Mycena floridula]